MRANVPGDYSSYTDYCFICNTTFHPADGECQCEECIVCGRLVPPSTDLRESKIGLYGVVCDNCAIGEDDDE